MKILLSIFGIILYLQGATILINEDFETDISDNWSIESGWKQTTDSNGNGVFESSSHSFFSNKENFGDYNLSFDFNLTDEESRFHVNILTSQSKRYFFGITSGSFYMQQQLDSETFKELNTSIEANVDLNNTHNITINHIKNNIILYLDNKKIFTYTDDELNSLKGNISFEGLTEKILYIDNIILTSNEELTTSDTPWEDLGGPIGGLGYDIRFHPLNNDIMYVTDNHAGVGRSDDRGKTWTRKNKGITIKGGYSGDDINIFSLTIDQNNPDIIWSGTQGSGKSFGVFKSSNAAESWEMKINGIALKGNEEGLIIRGFTVENNNSNIVYVQTEVTTSEQGREFRKSKGRVYKTTDGGENWSELLEVESLTRYLIIDPTDSKTLYVSTGIFDVEAVNGKCEDGIDDLSNRGGSGIYKSSDGGVNWLEINNGLDDLYVGTLRMDPNDPQILYAGVGNNACSKREFGDDNKIGLYKTTNGGSSWERVIPNYLVTAVNISPQDSNIVYAGSDGAFFRSTDKGVTWSTFTNDYGFGFGPEGVNAGFPIDLVIDPSNSNIVYVNNYGGGVIKSTDGGESWINSSEGISGATLSKLHVNDNKPHKLYAIGRSGPFLSDDKGDTFRGIENFNSLSEYMRIVSKPDDPNIILLSSEFEGSIMRSSDNGKSFTSVLKHPEAGDGAAEDRYGFKAITFSPSDPNIVMAGIASDKDLQGDTIRQTKGTALYKSTDGGATFNALSSSIDTYSINEIVFDKSNSENFLVGTALGIFSTINGGESFTHNLIDQWIEDITILKDGRVIAGAVHSGIYTSEDFGKTWNGPFTTGFTSSTPYITSVIYDDINSSILYCSDLYSGTYKSMDKGKTWESFPDFQMSGLKNRAVADMVSIDGLIYAGTEGGGIFRLGKSTIDINTSSLEINTGWNLLALPVDTTIELSQFNTTFKNADTIWKYLNKWKAYGASSDTKTQLANAGIDSIDSISKGEGFWINQSNLSENVEFSGIEYNISTQSSFTQASSGWKLLGSGEDINSSILCELNENIDTIWAYKNNKWSAYSPDTQIKEQLSDAGINNLDTINQGEGFWIYTK